MTPISFQEFSAGVQKAEDSWSAGDWRAARDTYSDLLYRRMVGGAAVAENELLVAERLADLAVPFGDFAEADDLYASISEVWRSRRDWEHADLAVLKRVHLAVAADRLDDAANLLREAEERTGPLEAIRFTPDGLVAWELQAGWRGSDRLGVLVQFYLVSGRILAAWGQFPSAVEAFRHALAHCAKDAPLGRRAEIPLRLALASAVMEQGELAGAQAEIEAVDSRIDQAREPGFATSLWETSAKILLLRGNFSGAESKLRQVLDLCRRLGLSAGTAKASTNLAEVLIVLNRVHEAVALLDEASRIAQELSNPAVARRIGQVRFIASAREGVAFGDEPLALPVLAMQAGYAGKRDSAEPRHEAPSPPARPASYLAFYEARELEFLAHVHNRDLDAAESALRWMRSDFTATSSKLIDLRVRMLTSILAYERGRYSQAEVMLNVAAEEFRAMGLLPDLYQCRRLLALCWDKLEYPAARRAALREENDALIEKLAASLGREDREAYLLNKWAQRELLLGQEIDQLAWLKAESASVHGWRGLAYGWKLFRQAGALIRRIEEAREGAETAVKDAPLWCRMLRHPWRRRTVGFLVLPNSTFTYSIGWLSLRYQISPATRVRIRSLVKSYQQDIITLDGRSQARASRTAAQIAEALGLPELLRDLPGRVKHLTFVPDDQLHGFPFSAIPLGPTNGPANHLGVRWTTSISFSTRSAAGSHRPRVRTALIAGTAHADGYLPLPETPGQCHTLARWLAGRGIAPTVMIDEQLTRTALFESLEHAHLFHFSGHAILRPDAPESSGLILPKADAAGQTVRVLDLLSRPLAGLRHATLAACWAADGYVFPGGHSVSFPRLLAKAGVGSILAPLWEVEDRVSSEFLQTFYAGLAFCSRAEALRRAQQYVVERGYASPYWWAAFQIYGDAGRLQV